MAIVVSVLTGGVNNHETTSEEVNGVYTDFVNEGVVGPVGSTSGVSPATGGFAVNAEGTPDMAVDVSAGTAYVTGTPTSQGSQTFRVKNSSTENVTISANSSGSTKYDWLYIKLDATNLNAPNTAGDNVATLVTSRSSSANSDDGTPPTYGYPLAVVTVANGASSITNGNIRDLRAQVILETGASNPAGGWTAITSSPDTITALGNRSYTVRFPSVDLTGTVSNGMRLKLTRTVTAPTQCADLESGSSQYFSLASASITGMTFTDDFVVSAWIKLESYGDGNIASRYNGTSGWFFGVNSSGQLRLAGRNAGAANTSEVLSYQSVPLGRWVHVAAQLDMSAFTATSTTSYMMIDGIDVPVSVSRGGTNPTALVQAGNLEIGGSNGGGGPFDGKIAQVAVYSAKVTQATIKASMNQGLTGSETSLAAAYSLNNDITDLSSNGNDLTAQGSATATATDSPFSGGSGGTTEYGIITAASFSTNTTLTVQVPEGCAIPTSGGVSAVSYSTQKAPYGMPISLEKWSMPVWISKSNMTKSSASTTTYYSGATANGEWAFVIPVGSWRVKKLIFAYAITAASQTTVGAGSGISTSNSTLTIEESRTASSYQVASGTLRASDSTERSIDLSTSSATTYYVVISGTSSSLSSVAIRGDDTESRITLECAYL